MTRLLMNDKVSLFSSKLDIEPEFWDVKLEKFAENSQKSR